MKKIIPNYENYVIYDTGDIMNLVTGKFLSGSIRLNGYKEYRISKDNKKIGFYAHRLVAELFIDNPDNLPVVNHRDGNKLNNDVSNLEWVSYSDNAKHAHQNGLIKKNRPAKFFEQDLEDEIWKNIPNFPLYQISSKARVKNIKTNRILKPSVACGYYKIRLSNNGQTTDFILHILMYKIFNSKEIPEGYKIDHIDGNKLNNEISNLRCISNKENALAALYETNTNNCNKTVLQFDLNGNFIQEFPSIREASRQLNLDSSTISKVCRGKNKSHGGFTFKYKNLT